MLARPEAHCGNERSNRLDSVSVMPLCETPTLHSAGLRHSPTRRRRRSSLASVAIGLLVTLSCSDMVAAQQESDRLELRKLELEVRKLELEVSRLRADDSGLPDWFTVVLGLLVGVAGTSATVWVARLTRLGALDQSVHDKRLELYGELVSATSRLALFFPSADADGSEVRTDASFAWISPADCGTMGRAMSRWYFAGGGLLLSVEARDAYFRFARALTRASLAERLSVPVFPTHAADIGVRNIRIYEAELLRELTLDDVEHWRFGDLEPEEERLAFKFKDYLFLQRLSSRLRTALSADLRSRRRPS